MVGQRTFIFAYGVAWKVEGFVQLSCNVWLEYKVRFWIGGPDMTDIFKQRFMDRLVVIFPNEEDVSRWRGPL